MYPKKIKNMENKAENRFSWTWSEYIKALNKDSSLTLKAFCRRVNTNAPCMQKWVSRQGYSVTKIKSELNNCPINEDSKFKRIEAVNLPEASYTLQGVSITFNSGTIVTIKQGTSLGVIKLIQEYERKDGELCIH